MSAPVQAASSWSPAGIVRAIIPWIVVLIIAIILIVVIFGAKPTIGGLQI
jgi:hypothetical protein